MKKVLSVMLAAAMVFSLAACSSTAVVTATTAAETAATEAATTAAATTAAATQAAVEAEPAAEPVKTGLSMIGSLANSAAPGEKDGKAEADVTIVAVTVDDNGVIDDCAIDMIQTKVGFDKEGKLLTDTATVFSSKNELGDDYGMRKASAIGKEWNEQAAAFAEYCKGKTVAELEGIAVGADGKATDADLAASVSLAVGEFVPYVVDAVNKAEHLGAGKGDKLVLTSESTISKSKDATADKDGQAQAYDFACALTLNGDEITSCFIDALQGTVKFNNKGEITSDITAAVDSKDVLGEAYGMKSSSAIGKEWNEQARAFAEYVTGMTLDDALGIAVTEDGHAGDADVAAICSVSIGSFMNILNKAKQ